MTKVCKDQACVQHFTASCLQLKGVVYRSPGEEFVTGSPDSFGYVNQHGLSRKHIFDSVQHSLKRLQLDYIDVLQCSSFRGLVAYANSE